MSAAAQLPVFPPCFARGTDAERDYMTALVSALREENRAFRKQIAGLGKDSPPEKYCGFRSVGSSILSAVHVATSKETARLHALIDKETADNVDCIDALTEKHLLNPDLPMTEYGPLTRKALKESIATHHRHVREWVRAGGASAADTTPRVSTKTVVHTVVTTTTKSFTNIAEKDPDDRRMTVEFVKERETRYVRDPLKVE